MRILIAEDDPTSRAVLWGVLQKSGYDVVETCDGAAAWAALQQPAAPALAILDWMMPAMDGLEVVRRVRARTTSQPPYLIILTTRGEQADIVTGLAAGADDYVTKPFDPSELRARIEVGRRLIEMQEKLAAKEGELLEAFDRIKALRGVVPVCARCKTIRDDQDYWSQVEAFVDGRAAAQFSPGLCPNCAKLPSPRNGDAGKGSGRST